MNATQLIVHAVTFISALLFGVLKVGAAPVLIATLQFLGFATVTTVFPIAILLNGVNSGFAPVSFARGRSIDWRNGSILSATAILSFAGSYLADHVPVRIFLNNPLVVVPGFLGIRTLMMANRKEPEEEPSRRRVLVIGIPAAAFGGFFGGLLPIGGGGILAPLLLIIGYRMKRASGTTALVATAASLAGFLGFIAHASVPLAFLIESIVVLDENLPIDLVAPLARLGHDVDTIFQEKLTGQDDATVWEAAQEAGRFLVSQDLGFSEIRSHAPGHTTVFSLFDSSIQPDGFDQARRGCFRKERHLQVERL